MYYSMGFIPERLLMMMTTVLHTPSSFLALLPLFFVLEFVCLPWSEVCSARVTSLLLLLLVVYGTLVLFTVQENT